MKAIIGKKLGMTQLFTEDGAVVPVTVIEAGPCPVVQVKTVDTDGYNAVQLGFSEAKPLKRVPHSESEKFPGGQYAHDPEDEAILYPPDRTMIVPMHPTRD